MTNIENNNSLELQKFAHERWIGHIKIFFIAHIFSLAWISYLLGKGGGLWLSLAILFSFGGLIFCWRGFILLKGLSLDSGRLLNEEENKSFAGNNNFVRWMSGLAAFFYLLFSIIALAKILITLSPLDYIFYINLISKFTVFALAVFVVLSAYAFFRILSLVLED